MYLFIYSIKLNKNSVTHEFETEDIQDENKETFNWAEVIFCNFIHYCVIFVYNCVFYIILCI